MVFDPPFGQKSIFGLGGVKFFITNLDHLLGLNYPESSSSIGLMVEAVDTFRGAGAGAGAVLVLVPGPGVIIQKTSAKSDLAFWFGHGWGWAGLGLAWLSLAWLWLRFVNC